MLSQGHTCDRCGDGSVLHLVGSRPATGGYDLQFRCASCRRPFGGSVRWSSSRGSEPRVEWRLVEIQGTHVEAGRRAEATAA